MPTNRGTSFAETEMLLAALSGDDEGMERWLHPNPLMVNPWADLTDDEIVEALVGARARVDAAMHAIHSLELEASRRLREPAESRTTGDAR